MKKILFLLFTVPMFLHQEVSAQKQFSDGQVTYSVTVEMPPGAPAGVADLSRSSGLTYSFKNYMFRSDMSIGKNIYTNIRNSRNHTAVSLIDDGGVSKYLIRFNPDELAEESARFQGLQFKDTGGSRKIAGYTCREAIGQLKDGTTFTLYYTPDLIPEDPDYNARFTGLKGLPLEFEATTRSKAKMTMTATSVSITPQPRASFDTPTSGYREITYTELQQLRKGK